MRLAATVLLMVLVVVACAGGGQSAAPAAPSAVPSAMRVVATTTVLADLARNVAGPGVEVESLVPKGGEAHTFAPAPSDIQRVAAATVIIANGLGLDEWLTELARDAGTSAPIVELAEDLPGVTYLEGGEHEEEPGHSPGASGEAHAFNPHLWLDVTLAQQYVTRIAGALAAADSANTASYRAQATAFNARLAALDAAVRDEFAAIPAENRRIVSFHDAFPYFARAYGLEVVGVVVEAPGQDPSAAEVAALIDAIRASGVRAILTEVQFNDALARQIAAETGATVVADLYTDSLGDPPHDTYEAIVREDVDKIIAALR